MDNASNRPRLPGGFVNDDEDPWDAAARECLEEICAGVEMTRLIGVYHIAKRTAPSMIGIAYQARLAAGSRPAPGPEMLEVGVFTAGWKVARSPLHMEAQR